MEDSKLKPFLTMSEIKKVSVFGVVLCSVIQTSGIAEFKEGPRIGNQSEGGNKELLLWCEDLCKMTSEVEKFALFPVQSGMPANWIGVLLMPVMDLKTGYPLPLLTFLSS